MDIITEDGKVLDFDQEHHKLELKATETTPRWQLVATRSDSDEVVCIGKFDSTTEANAAKESLIDAVSVGNAWDASEFKEKYRKPRFTAFATASGGRGKF